jgi:hypothetical protein
MISLIEPAIVASRRFCGEFHRVNPPVHPNLSRMSNTCRKEGRTKSWAKVIRDPRPIQS